jgi:rhomboid family GlyGly-CTERM serine protease
MNIHSAVRFWWLPASLALLALMTALGGEEAARVFRYERAAILDGEAWRLFTGHVVHLGGSHLGLNLAGLFLVWLLTGRALRPGEWAVVLGGTALLNGLALLAFRPGLEWYVGLSGVLHGLLLAGVLAGWRAGLRDAPLIAGVVVIKLVWEQVSGPLPGSVEAAGGPVVVDAHLYGGISGVLAWLAVLAWRVGTGALAKPRD